MSNISNTKKVSDLSNSELTKAINDLIVFYNFTFFAERDVDISIGLTYAIEFLACSLGLVCDESDSSALMEDLIATLDRHATQNNNSTWSLMRKYLPYSRSLIN